MAADVRMRQGGSGQPVLLLVHGLGATGDVWNGWWPLLDRHWPGRWLAPDLPGHGGSAPLGSYTFESLAAVLAGQLAGANRVVVLGHSLGGVLGLVLAGGGSPVVVERVVGLGIKVAWAPEEVAKARSLAGRPVTWFDSRDDAANRYLRVSGLAGLVAPADPAVGAGLVEENGRWRLAMDVGAFGVGAPDMVALLAACRAPVVLARGEHDPLNTDAQLAALAPGAVTLAGLGHNAHVENPAAVLRLLEPHLRPTGESGAGRPAGG